MCRGWDGRYGMWWLHFFQVWYLLMLSIAIEIMRPNSITPKFITNLAISNETLTRNSLKLELHCRRFESERRHWKLFFENNKNLIQNFGRGSAKRGLEPILTIPSWTNQSWWGSFTLFHLMLLLIFDSICEMSRTEELHFCLMTDDLDTTSCWFMPCLVEVIKYKIITMCNVECDSTAMTYDVWCLF